MPPVSTAAFARHLRDLDDGELLAFLAALWEARGWETTVDDGRVVATRDDQRQTIAVVRPHRFHLRRPPIPDADVVVSTRADGRVAGAASDEGAEFLDPAALRDRLLYGVDRDTAERLYAAQFGRSLTVDTSPPGDETDEPDEAGLALPNGRAAVAVALVLLAAAVVGAPALFPAGETSFTTEATFTPRWENATETEAPYPPGLSGEGVESASELAAAHADAVRNRAYVLRVAARGPAQTSVMTGRTRFNYTVWLQNSSVYRFRSVSVFAEPQAGNDTTGRRVYREGVYANGTAKFRRIVDGNASARYHRYPVETAGGPDDHYVDRAARVFARDVRSYISTYLATPESTVECRLRLAGGECSEYRVVATGVPTFLAGNVLSYRAVARVQPSGRVDSLAIEYRVSTDGQRAVVEFGFRYRRFENVTVRPPPWLPQARNATAETPVPSGTEPADTETGNETATETERSTGS